jgi:hypothetical protein
MSRVRILFIRPRGMGLEGRWGFTFGVNVFSKGWDRAMTDEWPGNDSLL